MSSNCKIITNPHKKTFKSKKVNRKKLDENSSLKKEGKSFTKLINSKNENKKNNGSNKIFIIKKFNKIKKTVISEKNKSQNNNIPNSSSSKINNIPIPKSSTIDSVKIQDNIQNKENKPDLFNDTSLLNNSDSHYNTSYLANSNNDYIDKIFSFKEKNKNFIMIKIVL